jgi:hypothetical protein
MTLNKAAALVIPAIFARCALGQTVSFSQPYTSTGNLNDWAVALDVDSNDAAYCLASTDYVGSNTWLVLKQDRYGTLVWMKRFPFSGPAKAAALTVGPDGTVYLAGNSTMPEGTTAVQVMALDNSGKQLWIQTLPTVSQARDEVLGLSADQNGCYVACKQQQSDGRYAFALSSWNSAGACTATAVDKAVMPYQALFLAGRWLVTGQDNNAAPYGGARWTCYDSGGATLFGDQQPNTFDASTTTYSLHHFVGGFDSAGDIYAFDNLQNQNMLSGALSLSNVGKCYAANGSLQWLAAESPGLVSAVSAGSPNDVYVAGVSAPTPQAFFLKRYNLAGQPLWTTPARLAVISADGTDGLYAADSDMAHHRIEYRKYDPLGNQTWYYAVAAQDSQRPNDPIQIVNKTPCVHFFGNISDGTYGEDISTASVVKSASLSSVTSPPTIVAGGSASMTIAFNRRVSTTATVQVKIISGPATLSDGVVEKIFQIPAGQSTVSVQLVAAVGAAGSTIAVQVTGDFARRTAKIQVLPAAGK